MGTPTSSTASSAPRRRAIGHAAPWAVTGAEKCPERVYDALGRACARCRHPRRLRRNRVQSHRRPSTARRAQSISRRLPFLPSIQYRRRGPGQRPARLSRRTGHSPSCADPSIFGGYLSHSGPSPFADFEGKSWYRTGDLVTEDSDGVLTFRGRLKRFVKLAARWSHSPPSRPSSSALRPRQ